MYLNTFYLNTAFKYIKLKVFINTSIDAQMFKHTIQISDSFKYAFNYKCIYIFNYCPTVKHSQSCVYFKILKPVYILKLKACNFFSIVS